MVVQEQKSETKGKIQKRQKTDEEQYETIQTE